MRAEEHVQRQPCEVFDGEQEIAGWQMLAGFPVAPGPGGNAKSYRNVRDLEVFLQSPVFQPHTESDAGGVAMVVIFGVHWGELEGTNDRVAFAGQKYAHL